MRSLRFHQTGPALDVLRLENAEAPKPGPGQIRVAVQACGLNPADWALCEGLFPGQLPRGVGLEVSGTVDAIGADVSDVRIGDQVFGPAPYTGSTAGASEQAILDVWLPRPTGLDPVDAAALPMAVMTASDGLDALGLRGGETLLVHGAGTTVGYAAVQIAVRRGSRVIATAGPTFADALRAAGAAVTDYGDGMVDRILEMSGRPVDLVLDTSPPTGVLRQLVRLVQKPSQVLTLSDFAEAQKLGVKTHFDEGSQLDLDVLGEYAMLASQREFMVPVARVFPFDEWREATEISQSGRARGKLVLRIA